MSTDQEAWLHPLAAAGPWPTMTHGFGQVYMYNTDWHRRYSVSPDDKNRDGSRNNGLLTIQSPNAAASLKKF